jgi:hypothetical protein
LRGQAGGSASGQLNGRRGSAQGGAQGNLPGDFRSLQQADQLLNDNNFNNNVNRRRFDDFSTGGQSLNNSQSLRINRFRDAQRIDDRFDNQLNDPNDDRFLGNSRNTAEGQRGFDGDPRFRGNSQNLRSNGFRGDQGFDDRFGGQVNTPNDNRFLGNSRNQQNSRVRGNAANRDPRFSGNSQNLREGDQFDEFDFFVNEGLDDSSNNVPNRRTTRFRSNTQNFQ